MICQSCGLEAPTASVEFQYNIGLLIYRVYKSVKGTMCKSCIRRHFWECTLINLIAGWWELISFVLTPFLIASNIIQYLGTRSLAPVPWDARVPELDERALRWLRPHEQAIRARLRDGERMEQLAPAIGALAGVTPGQVQLYVASLAKPTRGDETNDPPLTAAHTVPGPRDSWTCSVCGGYVRRDATLCKHCKASFATLLDLPSSAGVDPHAPARPVAGLHGRWTCSVCGGHVRQNATFCKHCKCSFSTPARHTFEDPRW